MSFATAEDVERRKGVSLSAAESLTVQTLCDDATELILHVAEGSDQGWVTDPDNTPPPAIVKQVCVAIAYRAWSNPDAAARLSVDDAMVDYAGDRTSDALFVTTSEAKRIRRASASSTFRSVTMVTPYSGDG